MKARMLSMVVLVVASSAISHAQPIGQPIVPTTAYTRSFLNDPNEAVFKATTNLETGVDIQAWDTDLDWLAANLNAFWKTVLAATNEALFKAAVNLEIGVDVQAYDPNIVTSVGTIATQDANNVAITGGSITGITDLAVADGGTGTSTGSITGTGALTFTAGGTNQNVTLTPSGTGYTVLNGNVGIGTASPDYPLSVYRNVATMGPTLVIQNANVGGAAYTVLQNGATGFTSNDGFLFGYSPTNSATVWNRENTDLRFGTNNSQRMVIDNTGNVGIGTTDPNTELDVDGDMLADRIFLGSGATHLAETTGATDSGAYLIGVYDEFDTSNGTKVQDVLDDFDAAIVLNTAKVTNATHTGDVTGSGALTIADDKVLEKHLKAVNAPTDEYVLTYESTTGDFEWQAGSGGGVSTYEELTGAHATLDDPCSLSAVHIQDVNDVNDAAQITFGGYYIPGVTFAAYDMNDANRVGYWKLDEGTGATAVDSSASGNDGTLVNTPTWVTGVNGGALDFNGSNEYVSLGAILPDANVTELSVSAWVWSDLITSNDSIFELGEFGGTVGKYNLFISSGSVYSQVGNNPGYATVNYAMSQDSWHHVVSTYNGSNVYLYLDGDLVDSDSYAEDINCIDSTAYIGTRYNIGSFPWDGKIDDVQIWNVALDVNQVGLLYNYPGDTLGYMRDDKALPIGKGITMDRDTVTVNVDLQMVGTFLGNYTASTTWDPSSIADGDMEAKEITVTGAALGDFAMVSFSIDVNDLSLTANVTAADTVTAVFANNTGDAVDLNSGTIKAKVLK
jgi:hypothetical protein